MRPNERVEIAAGRFKRWRSCSPAEQECAVRILEEKATLMEGSYASLDGIELPADLAARVGRRLTRLGENATRWPLSRIQTEVREIKQLLAQPTTTGAP